MQQNQHTISDIYSGYSEANTEERTATGTRSTVSGKSGVLDLKELRQKYIENLRQMQNKRAQKLAEIIDGLPATEQAILLQMIEVGSYRNLAKLLGISTTMAYKKINKLKKKIYELADTCDAR